MYSLIFSSRKLRARKEIEIVFSHVDQLHNKLRHARLIVSICLLKARSTKLMQFPIQPKHVILWI